MTEQGTVVRVEGGRAGVRVSRQADAFCRRCGACQTTAAGDLLLWVEAVGLAVGDAVTLEVPLPGVWRSIALVFALPLAALVAGLVIGGRWEGLQTATGLGAEGSAVALGAGLAILAFLAAVLSERRFANRHRVRVLEVRHPG